MAHRLRVSKAERVSRVFARLQETHGHVETFLTHRNTFELLVAVILSAQCTDERVNKVTPNLFAQFPTPKAFATANLSEIKAAISSVNFFNNKAVHIQRMSRILLDRFAGEVPREFDALVTLPGVGRKTANVIVSQAFGRPGITVDTHVKRVSTRLGFCTAKDPDKIEFELRKAWPKNIWSDMSTYLILHGRQVCHARKPHCDACAFESFCPKRF